MTDPAQPVAPAMLFVPGSEDRKIAKIPELGADAVILDLEDAVAVSAKPGARRAVAARLREPAGDVALWVRVNPVDTPYFADDVRTVAGPGLAGVMLPKARGADDVRRLDDALTAAEAERPGAAPARIIATVETVAGLRAAEAIAAASPRVDALGFGAGDFSLDAGIDWPLGADHPLLTAARVELALASRAAGIGAPHDGAYPRHHDLDGLRAQAEFARSLGFATKHAIHPGQVAVIRAAFRPSAEAIAHAERVCRAFEEAEADGRAAISVDGALVDYPVWHRARRVLRAAGVRGPA
ncbi:MAG TPA: CoA ester lyase [Streptosporangiaceae bacterium]|jgi:citrate lyase beta subunit